MTRTLSRRRFVGAAVGSAGFVSVAGSRRSNAAQYLRQFVIPAVDVFEDNYVGQFVFVEESADDDAGDVPIDSCEFDAWPTDETEVYRGQLLDRRQEVPVAVEVDVYADARKPEIEPGTHFIVQNASSCDGEYVGLGGEWIQRQALVGEPRGPTVTDVESGGQPGFGLLAGAAGIGIGLLARAALLSRSDDRSDE